MTTRRKPLPRTSPIFTAESSIESVRPSTSGATSALPVTDYIQNPLPYRRRSEDNYFDLLDAYHSDSKENDGPPSYQQSSPMNSVRHQEVPHPSLGRLQLPTTPSTGVLSDNNVIQPPPRLPPTPSTDPTIQSATTSTNPKQKGTRPKLTTALEETSYFLGGLLSHPVESTKHFTILRHSHGLVYYKGPETSLAISVFSAQPLPSSRRLWLQLKGWSGNTGMAAKAFFRSNNSWINVTPERQVSATELRVSDERAWQRDIGKFQAKASKAQAKQRLRETAVVRIPFEASDGYFRLVMTPGDSRTVLCPSPVFRVASTSMSASCLKGASLGTLPIELGVRAAQLAANVAAAKVAAPLNVMAQGYLSQLAPVSQYGGYVQTAWDVSGMQNHIDTANQEFDARLERGPGLDRTVSTPAFARGGVIGDDAGPREPFPIRFSGIVVRGTGRSTAVFNMPTANLDDVPADILSSISTGVYFGWALVVTRDPKQIHLHEEWRQAIITVLFTTSVASKVAQRKTIRAYILHEYPAGTLFIGAKLKLCVMGYLRPLLPPLPSSPTSQPQPVSQPPSQQDQQEHHQHQTLQLLELQNDISITQSSLSSSRPSWSADHILARSQTERSITDRLVDVRIAGQRKIDRVPVHLVGVRNGMVGGFDRGVYGVGGVWVRRDWDGG